jgi:hypothetical protein
LVGALSGAAQRALQRKYQARKHEIGTWTMAQAKTEIASLVPDHKTLFTKQALNMTFNAKHLVNDIQKYGLYMQHGEMEVDNKQLAFEMLQEKMLDACPDIFSVAQSAFNLRFDFKPLFEMVIADAVRIVDTLTIHNRLPPVQEWKTATGSSVPSKRPRDARPPPDRKAKKSTISKQGNNDKEL